MRPRGDFDFPPWETPLKTTNSGVTSFVSLTSALRRNLVHFTAPPFPNETASLGFAGGPILPAGPLLDAPPGRSTLVHSFHRTRRSPVGVKVSTRRAKAKSDEPGRNRGHTLTLAPEGGGCTHRRDPCKNGVSRGGAIVEDERAARSLPRAAPLAVLCLLSVCTESRCQGAEILTSHSMPWE